MPDQIKYSREEGGFSVHVNGKKQSVFRNKGWMDGLLEWPGIDHLSRISGRPNYFLRTQFEYHGNSNEG